MRAVLLFVAAIVVAGCLSEPGPKQAQDEDPNLFDLQWAERVFEMQDGHDHRDPKHHEGRSTSNFETIGYNPLITDYHKRTAGGYLCGEVVEKEGRRLSVVHSWVSDVAFILTDVTEPTQPKKLGEFTLPNARVYDLGMTPDQRYVLLATDSAGMGAVSQAVPSPATWEDACTGERRIVPGPEQDLPMGNGVVLVDIRDPSKPAFADYLFLGGGHSIQVRQLGTRTFALVTTPAVSIVEVVPTANSARLRPASTLTGCSSGQIAPGALLSICGTHDGALQTHPVTKQHLAYTGNSRAIQIFDITDPLRPNMIGRWSDWSKVGSKISPTFVHEILPLEVLIEGKHYTFFGEECGGRPSTTPTCLVVLLDTTDPTKPAYVGAWTLPVDTGAWSGTFMFSLHYIAYSNGTLFVANYHGGLWAVDVSTPAARATMPTIGVFVPAQVSPQPAGKGLSIGYTPAVLDVNPLSDGTLITYDHTSGLYALRFDASRPAPAPPPWPLS